MTPTDRVGNLEGHSELAPILVIKLSALGDFVLAMAAFKAIRAHHADARITLLTTAPFVDLAQACGYFDEVWIDGRPSIMQFGDWLALGRKLRAGGFARVYDLQTSDRSATYFRLFGWRRRPEWSGVVRGCSHPHDNPQRLTMHSLDRVVDQVAAAGVAAVPEIDISWAAGDVARFGLAGRYALLAPGGSAHRPEKRWPAARYAALAQHLAGEGMQPVLLGGSAEAAVLDAIARGCPEALNLSGETSFEDIVALARGAALAVGNDTGPMHLIGAADCPSLVLYSYASDPVRTVPRGAAVGFLRRPSLDDLTLADVIDATMAPG